MNLFVTDMNLINQIQCFWLWQISRVAFSSLWALTVNVSQVNRIRFSSTSYPYALWFSTHGSPKNKLL